MPPFKDEHILMLAPGSHTTLAQLGLPESYTPASYRIRTRMFPTTDGKWEPVKVRQVPKSATANSTTEVQSQPDVSIQEEPEAEFVEDPESDEGAVYPLTEGAVTNMPALLALLQHIHNTLSPTLHTPILLLAQPAWTAQQLETLTQFFFERFKIPAFCILDSALAISYAYSPTSCLVVDVGYQKSDITAVIDYQVVHKGRTVALKKTGGDAMTDKLLTLLEPQGWTKDMCEQLKKNSALCEILPNGVPLPEASAATNSANKDVTNPAALASTGATTSGPSAPITSVPRGPGPDTEVGEEEDIADDRLEDDGVLDVASIVASGKTAEFLAAQERKKAASAQRKATREANLAAEAAASKPVRLPNSKREKAIFHYQKRRTIDEIEEAQKQATLSEPTSSLPATAQEPPKEPASDMMDTTTDDTIPPPTTTDILLPATQPDDANAATNKDQARAVKRDEKRKARDTSSLTLLRREVEIGTERFRAINPLMLESLSDAIHRTILSLPEIGRRSELWDTIIIVGNGSKVKGFKEALLHTLTTRYLISPSSATMFTSELPSNLSTPIGTGSQTPMRDSPLPIGQYSLPTAPGPSSSSVNQLLVAATTASTQSFPPHHSQQPFHNPNMPIPHHTSSHSHPSHSQSPTSIKSPKNPEYFPEFKAVGYEEAAFLGAQVAAKCIFVVDQGVSGGFLTRVQYNDAGPAAIHELGFV